MSDHDQEQPQNAPAQHETVADLVRRERSWESSLQTGAPSNGEGFVIGLGTNLFVADRDPLRGDPTAPGVRGGASSKPRGATSASKRLPLGPPAREGRSSRCLSRAQLIC